MPKSIHRPEHLVLSKLLRERRLSSGMSQVDLSRALGRPQSFVSDMEIGKRRLDIILVEEICITLGGTLSELVLEYESTKRRGRQKR